MDYTKTTLGELLSSPDQTIKRNAISILKVLQKPKTGACVNCGEITNKYVNTVDGEGKEMIFCPDCWEEQ